MPVIITAVAVKAEWFITPANDLGLIRCAAAATIDASGHGVPGTAIAILELIEGLFMADALRWILPVALLLLPNPSLWAEEKPAIYRPELAEAVYWVVTAATALRALAEVTVALTGALGLRALITVGGLGQLAGTALFVVNMWWRVRMPPAAAPPAR